MKCAMSGVLQDAAFCVGGWLEHTLLAEKQDKTLCRFSIRCTMKDKEVPYGKETDRSVGA